MQIKSSSMMDSTTVKRARANCKRCLYAPAGFNFLADPHYYSVPDVQQNNMVAMMAFLQGQLDQNLGGVRERQLFSSSLRYLSTASGRQVQLEDWMVTSFDLEFGPEIGAGGL
jgi:hypothetical protein